MKRNIAFLLALLLLFVLHGCKSGGEESPPEPGPVSARIRATSWNRGRAADSAKTKNPH